MYKLLILVLSLNMLKIESCTKATTPIESAPVDKLVGSWVLKSKFLGDAIDKPCGYDTKNVRELTLEIEKDTESKNPNKFIINGRSTVNLFTGSFEISSYDSKLGIIYVNIAPLGSTKIAGPNDLLECEAYLFDFLNEAKEFRIPEKDQLNIGRFKKDNVPSRDGGTYFMYERR